jgi:hypothetical protein
MLQLGATEEEEEVNANPSFDRRHVNAALSVTVGLIYSNHEWGLVSKA